MSNFTCKSTFCVINNPEYEITYKHDVAGEIIKDDDGKPVILEQIPTEYYGCTPQQICDDVLNKWISDGDNHTGAVLYCESALGLPHLHCVFESKSTFRPLVVLKRLFPKIHIEVTKGTKKDVEDYINKVGKFEEKGEKIIAKSQVGEIIGCQGRRSDLISINELYDLIYNEDMRPDHIYDLFPQALKQKGFIESMYFRKRIKETDLVRDVHVTWLCGSTGSGKTYTYVNLCREYGEDNVYMVSDYDAPFDNYMGQDIVFFDEFRGQLKLATFLICLQGYKQEIHARYNNKVALWTKVYISSPVTPYEVYTRYKDTEGNHDKLQQLYRRINDVIYCCKIDTPVNSYFFQSRFDCDLYGSADDLYTKFSSEKSTYKAFIEIGQARNISDCVYVKENATE